MKIGGFGGESELNDFRIGEKVTDSVQQFQMLFLELECCSIIFFLLSYRAGRKFEWEKFIEIFWDHFTSFYNFR